MTTSANRTSNAPPDRRVNVLFLIDELREMGGAERVLLKMIQGLPKERFACSLVTFRADLTLPVFADFPCPFDILPLRKTYDRTALAAARRLAAIVRERRIDVVHTMFESSDLWAGPITWLAGRPVLISSRRDMGILRSWKHRLAYRIANRCYDQVQTVSNQVRDYCLREDRLAPGKVVTVYNGIRLQSKQEAPTKEEARAALGLSGADAVVSTVAHVRRVKGIDVFIRTAAEVCAKRPGTQFIIAGENHQPDHYSELQALVAASGLSGNVRFLGGLDDVTAVLRASDAFCLLSRSEGMPNAALEAMAWRLPVVATAVGGSPEVVLDGETGYLVANEDHGRAAARLLTLLESQALREQMGAAGRKRVEREFTEGAMLEQLARHYETLLQRKRRPGVPFAPLAESQSV